MGYEQTFVGAFGRQPILAGMSDKLVELKPSVSAVVSQYGAALDQTAGLITKANRWLLAE